jgi:hypothetical protein
MHFGPRPTWVPDVLNRRHHRCIGELAAELQKIYDSEVNIRISWWDDRNRERLVTRGKIGGSAGGKRPPQT